jgi:site-specific DNA recombinase
MQVNVSCTLMIPDDLDDINELEAEKEALSIKLREPESNIVDLQPNLAALYRRKVDTLQSALASPVLRDEALIVLRGLVENVLIRTSKGELEVELVGDIAAMVELSLPSKTTKEAALPPSLRRSVKVVAGVGFEPTTFRL